MRNMAKALCISVALAGNLATNGAGAQEVRDCDWVASARNIVEPWNENTREFANGAVRITKMDTVEPAVGAFYLMIQSPPYDESENRQCRIIGWSDGIGYAALQFADLQAAYDPSLGLVFQLPARIYVPEYAFSNTANLSIVLNQATGVIDIDVALGNE